MVSEAIKVQGSQPVLQVLAKLRGRMEDMTPAWQDAGDELVTRAERRFETKTDPSGKAWAPWKPRTARLRAKEGRGSLLEYTRLMRQSMDAQASRDGLVLGLGRIYAPFHETGTRKMPRRGMLLAQVDPEPRLGESDQTAVLDILMAHLTGGLDG